mmetsp:Transcript_124595/g.338463  ORF Transcript_124595/g.338463 Transcript_124595/m.338463 type:complete len:287 (+) Transcript_124595:78-938(+)
MLMSAASSAGFVLRHVALLYAVPVCGALLVDEHVAGGQYLDCHWNTDTRDEYDALSDSWSGKGSWPCSHLPGFMSHHGAEKTVLCIGDSITAGSGVSKKKEAYPVVLHRLLNRGGNGYNVASLSVPGAFLQKKQWSSSWNLSHRSIWNLPHWKVALGAAFDIAVLQLGTNDAQDVLWNEGTFRADYVEMIRLLKEAQPQAKFIAGIPPPSGENIYGINPGTTHGSLPDAIRRVMKELGVEVVDNAQRFAHQEAEDLMTEDNVHPSAAGHAAMAAGFAAAIGRLPPA